MVCYVRYLKQSKFSSRQRASNFQNEPFHFKLSTMESQGCTSTFDARLQSSCLCYLCIWGGAVCVRAAGLDAILQSLEDVLEHRHLARQILQRKHFKNLNLGEGRSDAGVVKLALEFYGLELSSLRIQRVSAHGYRNSFCVARCMCANLGFSGLRISDCSWRDIMQSAQDKLSPSSSSPTSSTTSAQCSPLVPRTINEVRVERNATPESQHDARTDSDGGDRALATLNSRCTVITLQALLRKEQLKNRNLRQQVCYWKRRAGSISDSLCKERAERELKKGRVSKNFTVRGGLLTAIRRQVGKSMGAEAVSIITGADASRFAVTEWEHRLGACLAAETRVFHTENEHALREAALSNEFAFSITSLRSDASNAGAYKNSKVVTMEARSLYQVASCHKSGELT